MTKDEAVWGTRVICVSDGAIGKIVTPHPDNIMGCEIMLDDGEMRWEDPENLDFLNSWLHGKEKL